MLKSDALSRQKFDDIEAQCQSEKARLNSAHAYVQEIRETINAAKMNLKIKEANLELARANLEAAKLKLQDAFIYAPDDGVITQRDCEPGTLANFSSPLLVLEKIKKLKILATLGEKEIFQIIPEKTRAQIRVDSHPLEIFEGRVVKIYPSL
ncbi:HlyD family secretion protein, partial [Candidatus Riflebacteria bacterium]